MRLRAVHRIIRPFGPSCHFGTNRLHSFDFNARFALYLYTLFVYAMVRSVGIPSLDQASKSKRARWAAQGVVV
jgi:hypothetical protein